LVTKIDLGCLDWSWTWIRLYYW